MTRLVAVAVVVSLAACSGGDDDAQPAATSATEAAEVADDRFPEIVAVEATYDDGTETWSFDVTVSSPYDTPERYADGWRVVGPGGTVYGVHTLAHDHAAEQPFTRRQSGVAIPTEVTEVTIEGRDLVNGFGGAALTVDLEGAG